MSAESIKHAKEDNSIPDFGQEVRMSGTSCSI